MFIYFFQIHINKCFTDSCLYIFFQIHIHKMFFRHIHWLVIEAFDLYWICTVSSCCLDAFSHNNEPLCWFFTIHWLKLTSVSVADKYNCSDSIFSSENSFVLDPWWYFRCAWVTKPGPILMPFVIYTCVRAWYVQEVKLFRYMEISQITTTCQPVSYRVCLRLFWILLKHSCLSELWRMFKLHVQKALLLS